MVPAAGPASRSSAGGADAGVTGSRAPSDRPGGTLRVVAGEIDSLDPQRSYLPGVWNLMRLYTRTLVTYATKPGHTGELVPDLATDLGKPSTDGLTWTFTLRPGVRFENGRPITSRDVKYGIERSFASDVVVGGPTYVVDLLDDPGNPYAGPVPGRAGGQARPADDRRPPTTRTIVFKLRAPQPDFPFVMALPSSSPVPSEADTGAQVRADPVSSGPYAITSVDPETGIVLDRNPQWDPATDDVRTALPDRVVVRTGLCGVERDQALLAGSADIDISGTGVQAGDHGAADRGRGQPAAGPGRRRDHRRRAAARPADRRRADGQRRTAGPRSPRPWTGGRCRRPSAARPMPCAARSCGRAGCPAARRTPIRRPDLTAARAALTGLRQARRLLHGARRGRHAGQRRRWPTRSPASWPGSASGSRSGRWTRPRFYATDVGNPDNVAANGYGIVLATWTADFPTPGSFLAPAGRRPGIRDGRQHRLRAAERPGDQRADRQGPGRRADAARAWRDVAAAAARRVAYVPLAETRVQLLAGQRLRNGRGDAAVRGLRPRHRRRPLTRRLGWRQEPGARRRPPSAGEVMIEIVLNMRAGAHQRPAHGADPAAPGQGRRSLLDVRRRGVLVARGLVGRGEEPEPAHRLLRRHLGRSASSAWASCSRSSEPSHRLTGRRIRAKT